MVGIAESRRARCGLFALAVSLGSLGNSCSAAVPHTVATPASHPIPPDLHGEPLAFLPSSPLVWVRVDMRAVRVSQHWEAGFPLLAQNAGEGLATIERELGFDPIRVADMVALGLYAAPGARPGDGSHAWPVFYARGAIQREAILVAARARARPDDPLIEHTVDGVRFLATRERGYLFPANDVVFVFDAALTRRVLHQIDGTERSSVGNESRFDALWTQIDGRNGAIEVAGDAASLRAIGAPVDEVASAAGEGDLGTSRIEQAVMAADLDAAVHIRVAALASDNDAAQRIVSNIDAIRSALLHRWDVRLLGMTRLLMQGLTDVHEERIVRIHLDAEPAEVVRLLRVARLAQ